MCTHSADYSRELQYSISSVHLIEKQFSTNSPDAECRELSVYPSFRAGWYHTWDYQGSFTDKVDKCSHIEAVDCKKRHSALKNWGLYYEAGFVVIEVTTGLTLVFCPMKNLSHHSTGSLQGPKSLQ